jgi:hypothetical protein
MARKVEKSGMSVQTVGDDTHQMETLNMHYKLTCISLGPSNTARRAGFRKHAAHPSGLETRYAIILSISEMDQKVARWDGNVEEIRELGTFQG